MPETFTVRLAEKTIYISCLFPQSKLFCKDYLADGPEDFSVAISPGDIAWEKEKSAREDQLEGRTVRVFSDEYLETLAIYRKIAERMPSFETVLFHGSSIAVDGKAYLFTARSGTGKSTHVRLWRQMFGERALMINDDKPLLRFTDECVLVYGTPWDGKHRLSNPVCAPLEGLCFLERGEENVIRNADENTVFPDLLQQTYRPMENEALKHTLVLLERLVKQVPMYRLQCNMELDAARVSYEGMRRGE